jgi:hypothetical protein
MGSRYASRHGLDWKAGRQIMTPDTGEPSPGIQAFCARCILTRDPEKLVPFEKPASYEQHLPDLLPMLDRHRDEFPDNDHWPWQIYVRQGRRIDGPARVTQHDFIRDPKTGRTPRVPQAIAIGEHCFDVHPCHDRRFAVDGWMEGVLWYPKKAFGPAQPGQVPYGALLPRDIDNLLVPVALSCTHVAMSVLRMEPLWMTTGQIAGLASAVAKDQSNDVANIDPTPLPRRLNILTEPPD